ncbi:hypothetical protein [Mycolicibacterium vinylchloridicum]|nr:hypothetical protein [Mycolicibacterium vinylchloridicum]
MLGFTVGFIGVTGPGLKLFPPGNEPLLVGESEGPVVVVEAGS